MILAYIKRNKGQVSIIATAIIASATVLTSIIGGWASASEAINQAENKIDKIEERENNHYGEVQKRLDRIDDKLDEIISAKRN